ncbi:hypothetical protein BKA66DRAFT_437891 [Pyrenochaeta sp. MPI-SDFR-AT-0127]|nr:hypothetical protein BKA66DRAFT_437891 [Pyrenochaeta sp. MPI-SDFR-AT-0127]
MTTSSWTWYRARNMFGLPQSQKVVETVVASRALLLATGRLWLWLSALPSALCDDEHAMPVARVRQQPPGSGVDLLSAAANMFGHEEQDALSRARTGQSVGRASSPSGAGAGRLLLPAPVGRGLPWACHKPPRPPATPSVA